MTLKTKCRLTKDVQDKVLTKDGFNCIHCSYIEEGGDMPLARLVMGDFPAVQCKSFDHAIADMSKCVDKIRQSNNAILDLTAEIHLAALSVAIKSRRGKANHAFVNKKTMQNMDAELINWFKENRLELEVCKYMDDNMIFIGYFGGPFDRSIQGKKSVFRWKYIYAPDLINANCALIEIL